ncbi:hypothetical protein EBI00_06710 [Marinomonas hwangdonensis]|uniref:Type I restriction modification DNA specificity domain-containing protein n=1 Tax=Marinomonas hwangdonensis TaxID=1053647 RepID=A0A3M8Q657_9GAMM|nr:restriction endonuclease subunit S [Marinomonas hwangdonensis]RNF51579.1 hypothetical protein EBI00_06710 [Marinomonas hwangdonensis]
MAQKVQLSDLFKIGSSKRVLKSQWQKSGVPFYRGREITKLSQNGIVDNDLFITEELYAEYSAKYGVPSTDDIVITAIGTIGNSYIVRDEDRFYFKDASVLWLKRTSTVESKYINLWLKSSLMRDQLDEGNGATVDTLTIKKLQGLTLDLPPIHEQKRIVSILDTVFVELEQARAKTEQNLKNARELFDSYLQQVFSQKGDGWKQHKLSELCKLISGQHIDAKDYNNDNIGIGYLTGPSDFGVFNPIVTKWSEYPKRTAIQGDILITVKGSGVGKINMMSADELAISRQLMAVRPMYSVGELIYWFLSMQFDYFQSLANGAAIPGISRHDVLDLELSLPALNDQTSVLKKIKKFNTQTLALEKIYTDKIRAIDELKKSILQKAFSGELTKTVE